MARVTHDDDQDEAERLEPEDPEQLAEDQLRAETALAAAAVAPPKPRKRGAKAEAAERAVLQAAPADEGGVFRVPPPAVAAKKRGRSLPIADAPRELAPELPARYEPALPVDKIRASLRNPRRRKPDIEDLVASVRVHGVIVPIEVRYRPSEDGGTDYEITYGESRWTASCLVGRETIPAKVVECDDETAFERRVLENLQRNDVHPIDEAEGFKAMLDAGRDVDYIAQKTGKSVSWIYARLKLCELAPAVRDIVDTDRLVPSVALLIARIPNQRYQIWAAREVMRLSPEVVGELALKDLEEDIESDGYQAHLRRIDDIFYEAARGDDDDEAAPMTVREAAAHLQRTYMTRLELAKFDLADERLLADVGACTKCVFRTGNQRELFSDVQRADVCTNPPCFDKKTRAAFEKAAAPAVAAGAKVLEPAEAKRVFTSPYAPDQIGGAAPYVEADAPVPWDLLPNNSAAKRPTWEKLLGKKGLAEVGRVVAQDGTGAARELITKADAVKLLRETGKLPKPAEKSGASGRGGGQDWAASEEKRKAKREIHERALMKVVRALEDKVQRAKPLALWRLIASHLGEFATNGDAYELVATLGGVDPKKKRGAGDPVAGLVDAAKDVGELLVLIVQFMVLDVGLPTYSGGLDKRALETFKLLNVDWTKELAAETAAAKAAARETAAPKAKGGKKGASKR